MKNSIKDQNLEREILGQENGTLAKLRTDYGTCIDNIYKAGKKQKGWAKVGFKRYLKKIGRNNRDQVTRTGRCRICNSKVNRFF